MLRNAWLSSAETGGPTSRAAGRRAPGRGLVAATQWALLMPVLLLGLLGIVQGGIWLGARASVQQAAMAGAEHAAFASASAQSATRVASDVAHRAGLQDVQVVVGDAGTAVQVEVTARAATILPGDWSWVSASSYRVKEA